MSAFVISLNDVDRLNDIAVALDGFHGLLAKDEYLAGMYVLRAPFINDLNEINSRIRHPQAIESRPKQT